MERILHVGKELSLNEGWKLEEKLKMEEKGEIQREREKTKRTFETSGLFDSHSMETYSSQAHHRRGGYRINRKGPEGDRHSHYVSLPR